MPEQVWETGMEDEVCLLLSFFDVSGLQMQNSVTNTCCVESSLLSHYLRQYVVDYSIALQASKMCKY